MLPYGFRKASLHPVTVGADSISARRVIRLRKITRVNTVRPYTLITHKISPPHKKEPTL